MTPLGRFLSDRIAARGQNPDEFARQHGLNSSHVYQIINGRRRNPRRDTMEKIAAAFGMTLAQLEQHLSPSPREQIDARRQALLADLDRWTAAVGPDYEEYFWQNLTEHGDSTARLIHSLQTAVSDDPHTAVSPVISEAQQVTNGDGADGEPPLSVRKHTAAATLARVLAEV